MSLLQKQKDLEDAPDSFLQQLLQQGNPQYPGWLVAAVADQRADFRQRQKNAEALRQAEQPTMVQNVSTKLGGIPDVDPNQMGDPSLATGIAGGMAVAGGGMIPEYRTGGLTGDDDDPEETMSATDQYLAAKQHADELKAQFLETRKEEMQPGSPRGMIPGGGHIEAAFDPEIYAANRLVASLKPTRDIHGRLVFEDGTFFQPEASIQGSAPFSAEIGDVTPNTISRVPDPDTTPSNTTADLLASTDTGQETDDTSTGSSQDFIDAFLADRQAGRAAAQGRFERVLGAGERVIDDYAKARAPDEDDRAIYRRERRDLNLALSQARRVADERGDNAEERQEIYDNLVGELQSQDRQRRSSRTRRQQVQATRARGVGLGSLGDSSGRERMATFIDDMRDEEIKYENQLRTDTREDSERVLQNLTNLQNYEETTGTDLDDAVLANSRGKTTLLGDLLDTDETLEERIAEMSLDLYGKALSPSASLDAAARRDAAAAAAARNAQSVQEFQRNFFEVGDHKDREALIDDINRAKSHYFNLGAQSMFTSAETGVRGQGEFTSERRTTPVVTERMQRDIAKRFGS